MAKLNQKRIPLSLQIVLHYYKQKDKALAYVEKYECDAKNVKEVLDVTGFLIEEGLLSESKDEGDSPDDKSKTENVLIGITDKGICYCQCLCQIPLPDVAWTLNIQVLDKKILIFRLEGGEDD